MSRLVALERLKCEFPHLVIYKSMFRPTTKWGQREKQVEKAVNSFKKERVPLMNLGVEERM